MASSEGHTKVREAQKGRYHPCSHQVLQFRELWGCSPRSQRRGRCPRRGRSQGQQRSWGPSACVQDDGKHTTGPWAAKRIQQRSWLFLYMSDSISPLQGKYLNDVQANLDHVPSGDTEIHLLCACMRVCAYVWCVRVRTHVCMCVWASCCLTSLCLCGEHGVFPHEKCNRLRCLRYHLPGHLLSRALRPGAHSVFSVALPSRVPFGFQMARLTRLSVF